MITSCSPVLGDGMTDEQKAFEIWRVFKEGFYHYNAAEGAKVNGVIQSDLYDPIKMLNCYENNGCSTHAINLATLWTMWFVTPLVINALLLYATVKVLPYLKLKEPLKVQGIKPWIVLVGLLTLTHGVLWLALDRIAY